MKLHLASRSHRQADWSEGMNKKKSAGVQDMTLLSTITNEAINDNLKARFFNQEIYVSYQRPTAHEAVLTAKTYIAHVLISVNPFRGELTEALGSRS